MSKSCVHNALPVWNRKSPKPKIFGWEKPVYLHGFNWLGNEGFIICSKHKMQCTVVMHYISFSTISKLLDQTSIM